MSSDIEALQRQCEADHRRLGQLERRLEAGLAERQSDRLAEVQGSVQGLSEEHQSLQRRVEALDERLWRTNSNELGKLRSDLERQLQSVELQAQHRDSEVAAVQMAQRRHGARAQRAERATNVLSARLAGLEQQLRGLVEAQVEARLLSLEHLAVEAQGTEARLSTLGTLRRAEPEALGAGDELEQALASQEARFGSQLAAVASETAFLASETAFLRVKVAGQGERLEAMVGRLHAVHAPVEAPRAHASSDPGKAVRELSRALEQLRMEVARLSEPGSAIHDRVAVLETFRAEVEAVKLDAKEIVGLGERLRELEATLEGSMLESTSDVSAAAGSECTSTNCSRNFVRVESTRSLASTCTKSDVYKL